VHPRALAGNDVRLSALPLPVPVQPFEIHEDFGGLGVHRHPRVSPHAYANRGCWRRGEQNALRWRGDRRM
jgi:hypothetical protein